MSRVKHIQKPTQRHKQRAEKERKKEQGEKRRVDAIVTEIDGWIRRKPPEPFTASCLGCGKDIQVTYEDGRMQHVHVRPVCQSYRVIENVMGNESATLESWGNLDVPSPLAEWADADAEDLTSEEGTYLVDSGEIQKSCAIEFDLSGATRGGLLARTRDGRLCRWPLASTAPDPREQAESSPLATKLLKALVGGIPPTMTAKQLEEMEADMVESEARYAALTPEQQKLDDDMCYANEVREQAAHFGREAAEKYVAAETPMPANMSVKERTDYLLALEDTYVENG